MRVDIEEERLFVVSDLHLGNPASTATDRLLGFLDHVAETGASLCIDGDGFDMVQTRFSRLVSTGLPVLSKLRGIKANGGSVYYVVGNHDMVLEHFLDHVLTLEMSPFLNLRSGGARIRIEHGHLYDPFFARHPDLYQAATRLAGAALFLTKDTYKLWTRLTERVEARRAERAEADPGGGHSTYCHEAAEMLLHRGFDTVVFGHTHNPEVVALPSGTYVNCGNWLTGRTYVDIDRGVATLRSWDPVAAA